MTTRAPHRLPAVREWVLGTWLRRLLLPLVLLALALLATFAFWAVATYDLDLPAAPAPGRIEPSADLPQGGDTILGPMKSQGIDADRF